MFKTVNGSRDFLALILIIIFVTIINTWCGSRNQHPVISGVNADKEWVSPSSACSFYSVATDPDGDKLTYTWSANGGEILGEGPRAKWIAPEVRGAYIITVTISDNKGGKAEMKKRYFVGENQPPFIDSIISEYKMIERAKTCGFICSAHDPDGDHLIFKWEANRGNISGDGPKAKWVSANTYVNTIITLTVNDERGGRAVKKLIIPVVCCGEAVKNSKWPS